MPELPEVETIRRELEPELIGRKVVDATAHESGKFQPARDAVGGRFVQIDRRGKYLLLRLHDDRDLVIHLGMTGALHLGPSQPHRGHEREPDPYVRATWSLDDDRDLRYHDVRRFGRIRVVPRDDFSSITTLSQLGPEPLSDEFTAEGLLTAMKSSKRRVKTQLLSQRPVAGVGNIYAGEALWRAKVYPAARAITASQAVALHEAIVDVRTSTISTVTDGPGSPAPVAPPPCSRESGMLEQRRSVRAVSAVESWTAAQAPDGSRLRPGRGRCDTALLAAGGVGQLTCGRGFGPAYYAFGRGPHDSH